MSGIPQIVLSQELGEAIAGRRVLACAFTTFSFDPGFFELEILPVLFDRPFSRIDKVRRIQLEDALRGTDVAVYYDRSGLVGDAQPASLDFRRVDVHRRTGCFHPKLVLALVENRSEEEGEEPKRSLVLAVLSANLTRSGWWENIEAGHVEELLVETGSRDRCPLRNDLLQLLSRIRKQCGPNEEHTAIKAIEAFIRKEAPRRKTLQTGAAGRLYTSLFTGQEHLADWLAKRRLNRYRYHLEIVSPYLDKHGASALRRMIEALDPDEVRVLLPMGVDGKPDISDEQYRAVEEVATWSKLPDGLTHSGPRGNNEKTPPRRVHAKLFRMWRRGQGEVVVVGSANLTEAGCGSSRGGNLEASFLIDVTDAGHGGKWLLEPITEAPTAFRDVPLEEAGEGERVGAPLSVRFDWVSGRLGWHIEDAFAGSIEIRKVSGEVLTELDGSRYGSWNDAGDEASTAVRELLDSTSFLEARTRPRKKAKACTWRVLVREEGMSRKPSLLTQLSPEEILLYWSLLTPEQREVFLSEKLGEDAQLEGLAAGRGRRYRTEDTLFDRFAGLYHAFEQVARVIDRTLAEGNGREAEALLFGAKYDSVPELLRGVRERSLDTERETRPDPVHAYVTFLCARGLADRVQRKHGEFWKSTRELHDVLDAELAYLKSLRKAIPELDGDGDFLAWYEAAFLSEAPALEGHAR